MPAPSAAKPLNWLENQIGPSLLDKVTINSGPYAYRTPDGAAIVRLGLLGP
ncbi:MAG: hypothetical protein LBO75_00340 [Bifidobacteriaceae bacterium]|nr:hypothetical protein [Bifidobacteriaceae bacterium]